MLRVALLVALSVSFASAHASRRPVVDHLVPFTPMFDEDLRPLVDKKLLITPANCGRMIRMHQGVSVGESAVSVYCRDGQCYVTTTRAAENIDFVWSERRGESDQLQRVRAVPVTRKDAEISERLAHAFRDCLRAALRATRPDTSDAVIIHMDRVEFWLVAPGSTPLKAERSNRPGRHVLQLISLGDDLARYCELPAAQRQKAAQHIEKKATRLQRYFGRIASNQAMQLTASKPAIYVSHGCRRASMLRGMHRGLAAADLVSR
jgi:hypothetical protein